MSLEDGVFDHKYVARSSHKYLCAVSLMIKLQERCVCLSKENDHFPVSSYMRSVYRPMSTGNGVQPQAESLLSVHGFTSLFQETNGVSSHWKSGTLNR